MLATGTRFFYPCSSSLVRFKCPTHFDLDWVRLTKYVCTSFICGVFDVHNSVRVKIAVWCLWVRARMKVKGYEKFWRNFPQRERKMIRYNCVCTWTSNMLVKCDISFIHSYDTAFMQTTKIVAVLQGSKSPTSLFWTVFHALNFLLDIDSLIHSFALIHSTRRALAMELVGQATCHNYLNLD